MSTMSSTGLLIVGLNQGGAWAREIARTDDLRLVGLVDVDPARLARAGERAGVPPARQFRDFDAALEVEPDIVVLALPTPLHKEMSLSALGRGYHVICEKPLAMSLGEGRELRAAVQQTDRRFMVGENYRYADGCENLRRAIAAGLIGTPAYLDHEFFRGGQLEPPGRSPRPAGHWSRAYAEPGLNEMSVHHFDMWWYITGSRPVEVRADGFDPAWTTTSRRFGYSLRATLENGTHVHYLTCRALGRPQTTWFGNLWIVGDEGALFWDGSGSTVTLSRVTPTHDYQDQHVARGPVSYVNRQADPTATTVILQVRELVNAIREDRPHLGSIDDNWPSFATAMAAAESAQSGRAVTVAPE